MTKCCLVSFILLLILACSEATTGLASSKTVTLTVNMIYPDSSFTKYSGTSMTLRGSFSPLNWNSGLTMSKTAANTWQAVLQVALPAVGVSILEFKPMVNDRTWSIGANFFLQIDGASLPDSGAAISTDAYPWFFSYSGEYKYIYNVFSPQLRNTRNLVIYTPPSYLENTLKFNYPTLFMQDGQNLFNASTSFAGSWNCQTTVNQQVAAGTMEEIIIVGVDNTGERTWEYTYSYDPSVKAGGLGDLYLDFVADTVIPVIESTYPRANVATGTGILGSSLGALISCYAGYRRTERWPIAGCMSTSFWWNNQDFNNTIMVKYPAPTPSSLNVYLDSGDSGPSLDDVVETRTVLHHFESDGFVLNQTLFYYLDQGGQHNEYFWGKRFWIPMTYLYPPRPTPWNFA